MKTPLRFFATTPLLAPLLALLALHGCTSVAGGEEEVAAASKALTVAIGPRAVAYDFATGDALPHGIAGGHRLVFVAEALTGRVAVHGRFSGREIGELPAPPGGFLLPFALRVPEDGTLVVLDAGGFPSLEAPSIPVVYEYRYDIDRGRGFVATLERTVRFAGLPLAFVEDLEVLDDGRYVVSESILGALWVVNTDGSIEPGVFPASPDPADAVPGLNPCALPPGVVVDGIPFEPPGLFASRRGIVGCSRRLALLRKQLPRRRSPHSHREPQRQHAAALRARRRHRGGHGPRRRRRVRGAQGLGVQSEGG